MMNSSQAFCLNNSSQIVFNNNPIIIATTVIHFTNEAQFIANPALIFNDPIQGWIQRDRARRDLLKIQVSAFGEIPRACHNLQNVHMMIKRLFKSLHIFSGQCQ